MTTKKPSISSLIGDLGPGDLPRPSAPTVLWFSGLALLTLGQRPAAGTALELPLTGLGLLLAGSMAAIHLTSRRSEPDAGRKTAYTLWLAGAAATLAALALYATTLTAATTAMGLGDDGAARWYVVGTSLYLLLGALGSFPLLYADRVLTRNPMMVPVSIARRSGAAGLATGLVVSLALPVNYLASKHDIEYDYAYFRTTRAGTATLATVRSLTEPVHATLFFSAASDVKEQVLPYFDALERAGEGRFTYEVLDQAMAPELAAEEKIQRNGTILLAMGDTKQKLTLPEEIDRAKRDLKKLDSSVQKSLMKLAKGKRTVYMLSGHDEASPRETDDDGRKLAQLKRVLQSLSFDVKTFGATDGSTSAVPDDASLLLIAAPLHALLPEEEQVIADYTARGGSLLVMAAPTLKPREGDPAQPLAGVLAGLGLQATSAPLVNPTKYLSQRQGKADKLMLVSNRYGTHAVVKTLARYSTEAYVALPLSAGLSKLPDAKVNISTLIRSYPDTWADTTLNIVQDADEPSAVTDLAVAVEGGADDKPWRAVVVGSVAAFSDPMLGAMRGNNMFLADAALWLVGDEGISGETESEEDVKIQHTRDEDVYWFYGTVFGVPLLVMLAGMLVVQLRRK